MTSQYPLWRMALDITHFLLTWGVAFYVYRNRRNKAADDRLTGMETRLTTIETAVKNPPADVRFSAMETRLVAIEIAVNTPKECGSHRRMEDNDRDINAQLGTIEKLLSKVDGRLDGINRMVDLLTQNELNGGKK